MELGVGVLSLNDGLMASDNALGAFTALRCGTTQSATTLAHVSLIPICTRRRYGSWYLRKNVCCNQGEEYKVGQVTTSRLI